MPANAKFNLNPINSDKYYNMVLMYQIVGTMLRNTNAGLYEPYLAERWQISADGTFVKFYLKKNIKTSAGYLITAASYRESLHKIFKILGKEGSLVQFDGLVGMKQYLDGFKDTIEGISVEDNTISFKFMGPTDDILITFTEPYFGFYSPINFSSSGDWKSDEFLDSSGMYFVTANDSKFRIISIEKNPSYIDNQGPDRITLNYFSDIKEIQWDQKNNIVFGALDIEPENIPTNYNTIKSDPNMLGALVLSPHVEPFNDKNFRRYILKKSIDNAGVQELKSTRSQKSINFNFLDKPSFDLSKILSKSKIKFHVSTEAKIAYYNLAPSELFFVKNIFEKIKIETGLRSTFEEVNRADPKVRKDLYSNKVFSARFVTVVVGGSASNQNNIMMFCSKLGVRFPDPSGRLCNLFAQYSKDGGKIDQSYIDKMHRILYEDASVIPIFHAGFSWLVSDKINAGGLALGFGMPRFDLIGYK